MDPHETAEWYRSIARRMDRAGRPATKRRNDETIGYRPA